MYPPRLDYAVQSGIDQVEESARTAGATSHRGEQSHETNYCNLSNRTAVFP